VSSQGVPLIDDAFARSPEAGCVSWLN
jgi:hypothetical protein